MSGKSRNYTAGSDRGHRGHLEGPGPLYVRPLTKRGLLREYELTNAGRKTRKPHLATVMSFREAERRRKLGLDHS